MIKTPHSGEWGFGNLGHNRPRILQTQKNLVVFVKKQFSLQNAQIENDWLCTEDRSEF